jgi:hypothetical protein
VEFQDILDIGTPGLPPILRTDQFGQVKNMFQQTNRPVNTISTGAQTNTPDAFGADLALSGLTATDVYQAATAQQQAADIETTNEQFSNPEPDREEPTQPYEKPIDSMVPIPIIAKNPVEDQMNRRSNLYTIAYPDGDAQIGYTQTNEDIEMGNARVSKALKMKKGKAKTMKKDIEMIESESPVKTIEAVPQLYNPLNNGDRIQGAGQKTIAFPGPMRLFPGITGTTVTATGKRRKRYFSTPSQKYAAAQIKNELLKDEKNTIQKRKGVPTTIEEDLSEYMGSDKNKRRYILKK